jgi:hypothetical protein
MRELHAWHGDRRHGPDAAVDAPAAHAHDAPRLTVLRDPEARKAESLKYQKKVEAADARYAAEQLKHQKVKLEHAPPETRDKLGSKIAARRDPLESQREERQRPERSRLPTSGIVQVGLGVDTILSAVVILTHAIPGGWGATTKGFLGTGVAGVAWGNKRWKDKHGNRPGN